MALCTAVFILYVLTTPTFHALAWPRHRNRSIVSASVAVSDEVRSRWRGAYSSERERLGWAYYRLDALGTLDRSLSFTEFRRHRQVVLVASAVIGRRWQRRADPRRWRRLWHSAAADVAGSLWFRFRVLVRPTLLLGRTGRGRLPRLPLRRRFRRAHRYESRNWRYSVWSPYASLGEHGYCAGWYQRPTWDHEWKRLSAELNKAGVWTGGKGVKCVTRLPVRGGREMPDRAELEAQQQRREEQLERLGERLQEIADNLIELADAQRPAPPVRREREDPPTSDPPSSPPSPGSSGRSGGGSRNDDWSDWGDSRDFSWE